MGGIRSMTKLRHSVDPPLARRPVQLTLIATASVLLVWQAMTAAGILLFDLGQGDSAVRRFAAVRKGEREPLIQIDLNRAGPRELSLLPRIGPVLARRIHRNREREGPFHSVADLARVHGIGDATLGDVAPYVRIGKVDESRLRLMEPEGVGKPE